MADNGDRVFCHACGGVWSRADSDLTCPHCESDFTEIIEIPPDPDTPPPEQDPEPRTPPINPWADHNPWDRDEAAGPRPFGFMDSGSPGYSQHTYRSPDGRFTFSSTTIGGGYSSRQSAATAPTNPLLPMMFEGLNALFQGLQETHEPHEARSPGLDDPFMAHSSSWPNIDPGVSNAHAGHEGLFPRDTDRAQPMTPPVASLADLLEAFRTDFGGPRQQGRHGARGVAGPNPLAMLSALLNMDRNGDAVYSQEELDRVISQLIDHNNSGTAPPPASDSAIRSLPTKKVDREMLGSDGKAECSICMDAVELDTEVTVLPCTHWFHYTCIEAWLTQHNTCPHCRRGIDSVECTGEGTSENPVIIEDSSEAPSSGRRRRRSSPFSLRSSRSSGSRSTPQSPTPESSEPRNRRGSRGSRGSRSERGGITGWVWSRFGGSNE
ncbi:uncharacterized protein N7498_009566 [Penicillium cinerascens]|uniref:RING-type E3 ubiquitin transferase n=1 Tax=Penicillium cinerascens TaxID=70096 RepID=A0A9W9J7D4_9EURO|nr:uncharacterized protein N7498_009566 [Penicillium cinerascens]KAJ5190581.1 hypothetical protein N7498_009566 [Penicillium cinerascens]